MSEPDAPATTAGQTPAREACAIAAFCASSRARSSDSLAIFSTNRRPSRVRRWKFWSRSLARIVAVASRR
jgi:hypothetical protein